MKKIVGRWCYACGSTNTRIYNKGPDWMPNRGTPYALCSYCKYIIQKRPQKTKRGRRIKEDRECYCCGSHTTHISKDGDHIWRLNRGTPYFLCHRCFCHLFNPIYETTRAEHLIHFLGLRIRLGWNPRKGFCSLCGSKKDGWRTHMHHWFYLRIMPWACTIEICGTCHNLIHEKGGPEPWAKHKRKLACTIK